MMRLLQRRLLVALVAASPALAGCEDESILVGTPNLSDIVVAAMDDAIQAEYQAESIHLRVLADFGDVDPFYTILYEEPRHATAIASLYLQNDLEVPPSTWTINNVPTYEAVIDACIGAGTVEAETVALYDELLQLDLPEQVRAVFEANRSDAAERHLPAFQICSP